MSVAYSQAPPADLAAAAAHNPNLITARIDRLPATASSWRLVALISMGGWFELYDLFFTGYIAPGLAKSGLVTSTTQGFFGFSGMGAFIAATFAGLFVGTFFLGFLSDRYGRRFVFTWSLLAYTAATVVMACQTSTEGLMLWRLVAGIGLGVEIITVDAYITEIVPRHMRGRAFALNQAVMFTSVPVVALLAWQLVPEAPFGVEGWRWVVLVGATGAILVWFIRRVVPESPVWLAQKGYMKEADRIVACFEARVEREYRRPLPEPIVEPFAAKPPATRLVEVFQSPYQGRLLVLVVFNLCQVVGYYGFANWVPTLLLAKGITITKSLAYSAIIAVANPLGPLIGMTFADKVDRKWVIVGAALAVAVVGTAFALLTAAPLLIVCGVLITFSNTILSYAYHAYQVEVFPSNIRARAAGLAYSASRFGAMCSGFLIAFALRKAGTTGAFGLITACMIGVIVVIGVFGPSTSAIEREGCG